MDQITKSVQKMILAGIGAAATTAEKADELMKELVKKGEATVEQGKVVNEELKHTIKQAVASHEGSLMDKVHDLTDDELIRLKEQIDDIQKKRQSRSDEACDQDEKQQ